MRTLRLTLFAAALALIGGAAPSAAAAAPKAHGAAKGKVDLPDAKHSGHLKGLLFDTQGNPVRLLEAKLARKTPGGAALNAGVVEGALFKKGQKQPVALVHGHYAAGPNGNGMLLAMILKPQGQGQKPKVVGWIALKLHDPNPSGQPGVFAGKYAVF